jgi:hypothetical protein
MTALPSPLFGAEIDKVAPKTSDDWRSGTPTVAVMSGSHTFIEGYRKQHEGRFAIVLVTDGYPQGCSTTLDNVDSVVDQAKKALAVDLHTYVIGVANPKVTGAPDTVSDLHRIAAAGGTEQAFLIDTGDPTATATAFTKAMDKIRQASISCSLPIPTASSGPGFDKQNVAVTFQSSTGKTTLVYDKSCSGTNGWHYDQVASPSEIVLCESTCNAVRADLNAKLEVEFACEPILLL